MIRIMAPDQASLSGGLKVIYAIVRGLDDAGVPARVWHGTPGYVLSGMEGEAPTECAPTLDLEPGDVLVMPEVGGSKWADLNPGVPTVILVQGIDFVLADCDFLHPRLGAYPGWSQVAATIVVSEVIDEFMASLSPDLPRHRVPISLDLEAFAPVEKERLVAFMPRRRREDLLGVVQLLHRHGRLRDWSLLPIDGMTPAEVAASMARSAIFLSGGEREGFGLPAAEAMAAGAHVVGFTGHGQREFMRPDLASVIPESDVVAMASAVEAAMDLFDHDRAAFDARAAAGRALVEGRYTPQRQNEAALKAFAELAAPGSGAVIRDRVTVNHYQTRAPSSGPIARARRIGGRALRAGAELRSGSR